MRRPARQLAPPRWRAHPPPSPQISQICPELDEPPGTGGTSGSGGTSGGGGSPGNGGSIPGAGCATCVKAERCCRGVAEYAGEDPASCDGLASACEGAGAQQSLVAEQCVAILNSAASLPVDECK